MTKKLLLMMLLMPLSVLGQAVRVDVPILTSGPSVPTTGGAMPQALWISNATVQVCQHPATLQSCTPAVTYNDVNEDAQCPSSTPLVQLPGTTCTASAGSLGNVGFWYGGGTVDYIVNTAYGTFGPYTLSQGAVTGAVMLTPLSHATQTILGPLNLSGYGLDAAPVGQTTPAAGTFTFTNNVVNACSYSSGTADAQLIAALATGKDVDATCYGATTPTIARTVTIGPTCGQRVIFSPLTRFQPSTASLQMFNLGPCAQISGLHVDASSLTYTGTAINVASNVRDGDNFWLVNTEVDGTTTSSGACLSVSASDVNTQSVAFAHILGFDCYGLTGGMKFSTTGTGFINANFFEGLRLNYTTLNLSASGSSGSQITGNHFSFVAEAGAANTNGVNLACTNPGEIQLNTFDPYSIFDVSGSGVSVNITGSGCSYNKFTGALFNLISDASGSSNTFDDLETNTTSYAWHNYINAGYNAFQLGLGTSLQANAHRGITVAADPLGTVYAHFSSVETSAGWVWQDDKTGLQPFSVTPTGIGQTIGLQQANGNGCAITAGAIGNSCTVNVPLAVTMPDTNYHSHCTLENAGVTAAGPVTAQTTSQVTLSEIALSTTSTGGGTVTCLVMHN